MTDVGVIFILTIIVFGQPGLLSERAHTIRLSDVETVCAAGIGKGPD